MPLASGKGGEIEWRFNLQDRHRGVGKCLAEIVAPDVIGSDRRSLSRSNLRTKELSVLGVTIDQDSQRVHRRFQFWSGGEIGHVVFAIEETEIHPGVG